MLTFFENTTTCGFNKLSLENAGLFQFETNRLTGAGQNTSEGKVFNFPSLYIVVKLEMGAK